MDRRRVVIIVLLAVTTLVCAALLTDRHIVQWMIDKEGQLREVYQRRPILVCLLGFVVYTCLSLIPGTGGKAVIFGWWFGFFPALLIVNTALTVAALVTFQLSRHLLHEFVHRRFGSLMESVDARLRRSNGMDLLTLRLLHAPYTLTNYAAGATDISSWRFWWTTQIGILPGNAVFAYAGTQLPSIQDMTTKSLWTIVDLRLLLGLTVLSLVPVLLARVVARWGK